MINRVLIRIKVVQMLYSYLLTQSEFRIEPAPSADDSADSRYAYRLYASLLMLVLELSGRRVQPDKAGTYLPPVSNKYLTSGVMVNALMSNNDIRSIIARYGSLMNIYDGCLETLFNEIVNSAPYRSYTHAKERDLSRDVMFWTTVIRTIIAKSADFTEASRRDPSFTLAGFDRGVAMALRTLESYGDNRRLFSDAVKSLESSLDKAYELYHALLWLPVELTRVQEEKLDTARNKYLPTDDDLNPSLKFVDNRFTGAIAKSEEMEEFFKENPFTWTDDPIMLRSLLGKILASDIYRDYMASGTTSKEEDCEFWRQVFKQIILPGDDIAEALESKSVYWNDDLDIMGTFVMKTIKRFGSSEGDAVVMLPKYKDEEDAAFGAELFISAVKNKDTYRSYIDRFINQEQWDSERLALMDIVIMIAAITELMDYPAIPVPVTVNEYVEIANSYSTPRSGQFINGILSSVIKYLNSEKILLKS